MLFAEQSSAQIQDGRLTGVSRLHGGRVGGSGSCHSGGGMFLVQR